MVILKKAIYRGRSQDGGIGGAGIGHSSQVHQEYIYRDFPGGTVVKNLPANAGDMGLIPGPGRSHMPWSN